MTHADPHGFWEISIGLGGFGVALFGAGGDVYFNIGTDGLGFSVDGYGAVGYALGYGYGWEANFSPGGDASYNGPFILAGLQAFLGDGEGIDLNAGVSGCSSLDWGLGGAKGPGVNGVGLMGYLGSGYSIGWSWRQVITYITTFAW